MMVAAIAAAMDERMHNQFKLFGSVQQTSITIRFNTCQSRMTLISRVWICVIVCVCVCMSGERSSACACTRHRNVFKPNALHATPTFIMLPLIRSLKNVMACNDIRNSVC